MSEFNTLIFSLTLYKVLSILVGLVCLFFGYRLFQSGVSTKAGELNAKSGDKSLVLKQAAPGTFFALFGVIIISVGLFKGLELETAEYFPSNTQQELVEPTLDTSSEASLEATPSRAQASPNSVDVQKKVRPSKKNEITPPGYYFGPDGRLMRKSRVKAGVPVADR
jgi:hypothetical protein